MPTQLSIPFVQVPTRADICLMCHYSSECGDCCNKCVNTCNGKQRCGLKENPENHIDRMKSWIQIVEIDAMSDLKKFGVLAPLQ